MTTPEVIEQHRQDILGGKYDRYIYKEACWIAKKLTPLFSELDELAVDAKTHLYYAAPNFDESLGNTFFTYVGSVVKNHFNGVIRKEMTRRRMEKTSSFCEAVDTRDDFVAVEFKDEWCKLSDTAKDVVYKMLSGDGEFSKKRVGRPQNTLFELYLRSAADDVLYSDIVRVYLEKARMDSKNEEARCCANCEHFQLRFEGGTEGGCYRFPKVESVNDRHTCGEFAQEGPPKEVLETELAMLPGLAIRTRAIVRNLGIVTIDDLLLITPGMIRADASPNRVETAAIRQLRAAVSKLGVTW